MKMALRALPTASIRGNILYAIAAVSTVVVLLLSGAVFMAYEDLEEAMLTMIFSEEESFFLSHLDQQADHSLQTANLNALFIPEDSSRAVPAFFTGITPPFLKELQRDDRIYLVKVSHVRNGTLYLAKDITAFERQEHLFHNFLLAILIGTLAAALLLAWFVARVVVRPLARLTRAIETLSPATGKHQRMAFSQDYAQQELRTIAHAFARYLDEMDGFVQRERRLLGMASHELRTPVAVISGALDVIDSRGVDSAAAGRALQRIRVATHEMRAQLTTILTLSRTGQSDTRLPTNLTAMVQEVIEDAGNLFPAAGRITWEPSNPVRVTTDGVLAKMLLRNLIHNALQHTSGGTIDLRLTQESFSIRDHGPGIPDTYKQLLKGGSVTRPPDGIIGLYLVALITERLGWSIDVDDSSGHGTTLRLNWPGTSDSLPSETH